jgi:uncharacterized protein YdiU (UPF0061 family)
LWNLFRLAECLLSIAQQSSLEQALTTFEPALHREFPSAIMRRLGLQSMGFEQDGALAKALWTFLHESKAPFEQTFFDWYGGLLSVHRAEQSPSATFYAQPSFQPVRAALDTFAPVPQAQLGHPYFARRRPCTMLIDEVEALWAPIAAEDDWSIFKAKLDEIRSMAGAYGITKPVEHG